MNLPNLKEARKRTNQEVKFLYDEYKTSNKLIDNKKYTILTYGCQMNVHDSEEIKAILEQIGYTEEEDYMEADIVILNTCAIRENAHNKVFGLLGRLKHLKETKKDLIVGVCGCMSQEESVALKLKEKYKWVNFVVGTHNIHKIGCILEEVITNNVRSIDVYSIEGDVIENVEYKRDSKYKAWINIMYGCDKFCTYCIVPYTRGKQRSRKIEDIISEVKTLIDNGYKEITLLGQNVNAYGADLEENKSMANLLEEVSKTGIERIRFTTSHPWDFTDEMIDIISKYNNIMPHIHLPVQSGSSDILKKMGRKYTSLEYMTLYNKLRTKVKNVSITTDVIVGFPNESDEDFDKTLSLVKECKFDSAFTFIYSKREGTPASVIKDSILESTKRKRLEKLNIIVNDYALENNKKMVGQTVKVLLENVSAKNNEYLNGFTENMKLVNVKCGDEHIGKIVNVEITNAKTFNLEGILS